MLTLSTDAIRARYRLSSGLDDDRCYSCELGCSERGDWAISHPVCDAVVLGIGANLDLIMVGCV